MRPLHALALTVLLGGAVAGCAGVRPLPYRPAAPSSGMSVSADYREIDGRLRVELETEGRRVEEAVILLPAGGAVQADSFQVPTSRRGGLTIGLGVGGGSIGTGGAGAGVGLGTGVGGGRASSTFVTFPLDRVGPPPWSLRVKVVGAEPVVIVLPPPPAPS